ncbi:MAG: site-specific integrase [Candidatus Thermoplasmatota archaeon]|nr:site-specific integrase [Candidatus Thermoplasmatota archaeon]
MPTLDFKKRVGQVLCKLESSDKVSTGNRETIQRFYKFLVLNDYSDARKLKYLITLTKIAEETDIDFLDATKEDLEDVILWLKQRDDLGDVTRQDYKIILKRFYKWVGGGEYPECVKWMKTTRKNGKGKLPEDMLDEDDVTRLLEHARNPRDRAFIALLWETGARIGELIDLRIGSFEDHHHGLKIVVDGKTGQRRIPLIDSVPYVNAWLESHPNRNTNTSPMWVNIGTRNNAQQMEYPAIAKMLRETAKRAKLDKPIHPHHFRHSRASYLANRFTEAQLCMWFGWVQGSEIPAKYVHLSGRDIDAEYARLHGIEDEEKPRESKLTPKPCPRCKQRLPPDAEYCYRCGMTLDLKLAMEAQKYQKIETMVQQQAVESIAQGQPIDMEKLAELVAQKLREGKNG